jgi:hypothetical protein
MNVHRCKHFIFTILLFIIFISCMSVHAQERNWNTFRGSSDSDMGWGIDTDGDGDIYVTGASKDTWGWPLDEHMGNNDVFVARMNLAGYRTWNTFMGSSSNDQGNGIALDGSGGVYVAGSSEASWGRPINAHAGENDISVAKLNTAASLLWNTFLGSASTDGAWDIAVDGNGYVYVTGYSAGSWGNPVNAYTGGNDAFVAKLDADGALVWNTFMGAPWGDEANGIAVDDDGNVYVAGYSMGGWGTPLSPHGRYDDALVAKLNAADGTLLWHTFLGGEWHDQGADVAVGPSGDVFVTGYSADTWFTPVNPHAGGNDAFVVRMAPDGGVLWNTFMGGHVSDNGYGIKVDSDANVFIAGTSQVSWGTPVNAHSGANEAFAAKLAGDGTLLWHTFMGGSWSDSGNDIVLYGDAVCLTGYSETAWGTPITEYAGGTDAFITQLTSQTSVTARPQTAVPDAYVLHQNYPNPFNPKTNISFELTESSDVSIVVFNTAGEYVDILFEGNMDRGRHNLSWNAHGQPTGIYYIRMQAGDCTMIRKCIFMR